MAERKPNMPEKGKSWTYYGWPLVTASQQDGISTEREEATRKWGIAFITALHRRLNTSYKVWATAITYLHRFYYLNSVDRYNITAMAAACFYIAGNPSITPDEILQATRDYVGYENFIKRFTDHPEENFISCQVEVAAALGWNLSVKHPYEFILEYLNDIQGSDEDKKKIRQEANMLFSESLRTLVCLSWRPQVLAVVMIHMAARRNGLKVTEHGIVKANDNSAPSTWWSQFVGAVSPKLVEEISQILCDSYKLDEERLPEIPEDELQQAATIDGPCGGMLALGEEAAGAAANTDRDGDYSCTTADGATYRLPPPAAPQLTHSTLYSTDNAAAFAAGHSSASAPASASGANYCASFRSPLVTRQPTTSAPSSRSWTDSRYSVPPPPSAGNFSTADAPSGTGKHSFYVTMTPNTGQYTTPAPPPSSVRDYSASAPPQSFARYSSTATAPSGSETSYYRSAPPPPATWPTSSSAPTSGRSSYTANNPPVSTFFRSPQSLPSDVRSAMPSRGQPYWSVPPPFRGSSYATTNPPASTFSGHSIAPSATPSRRQPYWCAPPPDSSSSYATTIPPASPLIPPPHALPPIAQRSTPSMQLPNLSAPPPPPVLSVQHNSAPLPTTLHPLLPPPPPRPSGTTPWSPKARPGNM